MTTTTKNTIGTRTRSTAETKFGYEDVYKRQVFFMVAASGFEPPTNRV